ncbi:SUMF1/EgtB/PvdO family nonheme iron enzyme [Streptomyces erythrochromogenes]|uniref:SUMF1/EgtB/PvdO family nonheme iron enzyme n=1 Tax=Streptomyces erythrochromogenes TaxID=285574 RepID=UPI0037FDBD04
MGTDDPDGFPADGEGPVREVRVSPFRIAATTVTNARFATFVKATGHVTEAEGFGSSFVFGDFPWEWRADRFMPGATRVVRGGSSLCRDSYCKQRPGADRHSSSANPGELVGNHGTFRAGPRGDACPPRTRKLCGPSRAGSAVTRAAASPPFRTVTGST